MITAAKTALMNILFRMHDSNHKALFARLQFIEPDIYRAISYSLPYIMLEIDLDRRKRAIATLYSCVKLINFISAELVRVQMFNLKKKKSFYKCAAEARKLLLHIYLYQ